MKKHAQKFYHYLMSEKRVADNTLQAYRRDVKQAILFFEESYSITAIKKIDSDHIKDFLKFLRYEKKVGARTSSRKLSALKTFGIYLEEYHNIPNFTQGVSFPKLPHRLPKHLSEKHVSQMLNIAAEDISIHGRRNRVFLCLLYVCGVRVTELVTMLISNINFDEKHLHIFGKGGKERLIPLPGEMVQMLRNYLHNVHPLLTEKIAGSTDLLFPTVHAKKIISISRKFVWQTVKEFALRAGIMHSISPHTLRHSLATHLLKKGTNLRLLQMLLGHEQLDTVQIYTHLDTSHLRELYDKMHPRAK